LVRIDPQSFDLRYLLVRVSELPPESETCEALTSVDYDRIRMGAGNVLLPTQSRLHLVMNDTYESDITTTYAGCREYHSEATIHFGDEPAAATTGQKADAAAPATLPAGLPISLVLAAPIDTETAAAGDVVVETVRKAVHVHRSGEVLVPEGATVRGRIIRMRHWLDSPRRFEIAIRIETWEAGGLSMPIHAKPAKENERAPAGQPPSVATFVFAASGHRYVASGLESKWVTVAAPSKP
jgi:hypothetical protein